MLRCWLMILLMSTAACSESDYGGSGAGQDATPQDSGAADVGEDSAQDAADDTAAEDARLIGVKIFFTTDSANDA